MGTGTSSGTSSGTSDDSATGNGSCGEGGCAGEGARAALAGRLSAAEQHFDAQCLWPPGVGDAGDPAFSLAPGIAAFFAARAFAFSAFFFDVFSSESAFPLSLRSPIPSSLLLLLLEDGTRSSISKTPSGRVTQSRRLRA